MVNCPFCNEKFYGEDVIFEFKWDDLSRPYIRSERDLITLNMPEELRSRAVYVTFELDSNDTARVKTMDTQPNPASAGAADRLKTDSETGWLRVRNHLKNSGEFIIAYSHKPGFESVPVQAEFYPYGEEGKSGKADRKSGVNRRMFCPRCYQQLKSGCMTADRQVKAIMVGRRAAGKTVFATQMISEFKEGTGGIVLNIEGANGDVDRRYELNKSKLRGTVSSTGQGFVLSTNTLEKQKPYIYVLKHPKRQNRSVCLTLHDIAGEHSENHLMYSARTCTCCSWTPGTSRRYAITTYGAVTIPAR